MNPGPDDPERTGQSPPAPGNSETLIYISDLLRELNQMAEKAGYKTLATILGMAQVEARIQSRDADH